MKHAIVVIAWLSMMMTSCHRHVEIPLQIPYAETAVEMQADSRYALYLLSEVEDTIVHFPDSIQMRYRLARAMARNAQGEAPDSTLTSLLEWFDAKGPPLERARTHHLMALTQLRQGHTRAAQEQLDQALQAEPSYTPSLFLSGYLLLWHKDYRLALERFTHIENYTAEMGIPMQGAWAVKNSLANIDNDFSSAMEGNELETARRMLTDMDYCLRYIHEHPNDEQADMAFHLAAVRDSILRTQYLTEGEDARSRPTPSPSPRRGVTGKAIIAFLIAAAIAAAWMRHRRRPEAEAPVFTEIVQRMEQLSDVGQQPSADEWESLRQLVQERHPALMKALQRADLSRSEMQMCLLSAVDLRQKQVATLLGISPQNLRNQRLRLLSRSGLSSDSVQDFTRWMESLKA